MALNKSSGNLRCLFHLLLMLCLVTIFFAFLWKPFGYFYPEKTQLGVISPGHSSIRSHENSFGPGNTGYYFHRFGSNADTLRAHDISVISHSTRAFEKQDDISGVSRNLISIKNVTTAAAADNPDFKLGNDIYGDGCPPNPYRTVLKNLLRYWVNISKRHDINSFACGGSLLGLLRNGDIIPYDRDIDLCMSDKEFFKLQPLESRKPFNYHDRQIHLALQKDFSKDVNDRIRVDCKGNEVRQMKDPCSFTSPWARVIFRRHYIDIFVFRANGKYLSDSEYKTMHFLEDIFPLKPCTLMGIQTNCPRNPITFLSRYYEPNFATKPHYVCRNSTWVPTSPNVKDKFQIWFA